MNNTVTNGYGYVDGSYNSERNVAGGAYLLLLSKKDDPIIGKRKITSPKLIGYRNVAGELFAAMDCTFKALTIGVDNLLIFYDYDGIEKWVTSEWEAKNWLTKVYKNFMKDIMTHTAMKVAFHKVKAHSNVVWNDKADQLAKEACLEG